MQKTAVDIMRVAQAQIGTRENPAGSNNVLYNEAYYGRAVSGSDFPWCVVFLWYVFRAAGASELFFDGKKTAYSPDVETWGKSAGIEVPKDAGQYGDIVTMDFSKGRASHVGLILARLSDGRYQTIEGNTAHGADDNGGAVMIRIRGADVIRGIFRPKYAQNARTWIQRGDSGAEVEEMQEILVSIGYDCGRAGVDGQFGEDTERAVKAFQLYAGLFVDGQCGVKTWGALREVYNVMGKAKEKPDFTSEAIISESGNVYKMAHDGKYHYADSAVLPPCADHKISCDRLEARTLWNLGMTDQRKGGEVVSTFPAWYEAHGFKKITNKAQLKGGDMVFVDDERHNNTPDWRWHMFTLVSYDPKTGMCRKYDMGSDARIQGKQPFYVQLEEWGGSKRFRFAYRTPYTKGALDGTYVIESAVNRDYVIDVKGASAATKANVQVYKKNGTQAQTFILQHVENGYYKIENIKSHKVLDVAGGKALNRQNIWQYDWNGTKAQLWKPIKNDDGSYTFISAINKSYVIDLRGAQAVNGQNIYLYKSNGTNAQKWYLVKVK